QAVSSRVESCDQENGAEGARGKGVEPRKPSRNPFSRGKVTSPTKRQRKDVFESLDEIGATPSPAAKKPALKRMTSFATEARTKKKHDRNVL
ncbi:unnamed protein product, partial [Discosporangium mesarthrocarpum]